MHTKYTPMRRRSLVKSPILVNPEMPTMVGAKFTFGAFARNYFFFLTKYALTFGSNKALKLKTLGGRKQLF